MSDEFLRAITTSEAHFQLTKTLGYRSYMVVPIADARETVGALTLVSCSRPLNRDDVTLAELLANHVGTIVAKAKHLDEASLTSPANCKQPCFPRSLSPCRGESGSMRAIPLPPNRSMSVVISTTSSRHQMARFGWSLVTSRATIDEPLPRWDSCAVPSAPLILQGLAPEDVIDELRRVWLFLGLTKTATLFLGRLNSSTGQLAMASAGHPPPLLVSGASADFLAAAPSPLLGRRSGLSAQRSDCFIPDGGLLLLYTDGALRERTYGVDDGMARLRSVALAAPSTPQTLCEQVIASVGAGDDDVALLAIMRRSEERAD